MRGGFTLSACSSISTMPVVVNPASSKTLAITLTAFEQAGQVGVSSTTSTSSFFNFAATSDPDSSINPVTSLTAPINE